MISFVVDGIPAPKGSMKAFVRGNRAIITADNKKTAPWAKLVTESTKRFAPIIPFDCACEVSLAFRLPRLVAHSGRRGLKPSAPVWQSTKPDIDKLARAVLDSLTKAGFWVDDSRVAALWCRKIYDDKPGVTIVVHPIAAMLRLL